VVEVLALSVWVKSISLDCEGIGILVLELKDRAASAWFRESWGTGISEMKTSGGKDGERMRMYQPRFGRWIDQQMVDVGLCYTTIT
jgi:hypothetical protein